MARYKATLKEDADVEDAKLEVETCGGSDIEPSEDRLSLTFVADVNDIPAIESMETIDKVIEIDEDGDDVDARGMYVGQKRGREG